MAVRFKTLVTVGSICAGLLVSAGLLVQTGCGGGSADVAPPVPVPVADVTEIFVSPSGDDANAGTLAAPVKSFERAQTLLRAQIHKGSPYGCVVAPIPAPHRWSSMRSIPDQLIVL